MPTLAQPNANSAHGRYAERVNRRTVLALAAILAALVVLVAGVRWAVHRPDPQGYLKRVHASLAGTDYAFVGDDELLNLGRSICTGIDHGLTRGDLGAKSTLPAPVLQGVVDAATHELCPEHSDF
jgi:hypothetical protein